VNFKAKQRGFTLIELLVVIVIVGVLATLATVSLAGVRSKARDAKRMNEVRQMQTAFEMFFSNEDKYPTDTGTGNGSFSVGRPLISSDGAKTYLTKVPSMPTPSDGSCPTKW
jgi:general secretion pathway protein G